MTAIHPVTDSSTLKVRCPADGRIVGTVQIDPPATVAAKADALRLFQPEWEALGPRGRKPWLMSYQEWVLDNAERITDLVQSESGKTRSDAGLEAPMIATVIDYVASRAERFLSDEHPRSFSPLAVTKKLTATYRPYPVVGIITPWNFPFMMPGIDIVPALAAGAAVLLKPSEVTPLSAVEFARGWAEIGAPPVLAVANGYGDTGAAVVASADFVQFTGSTTTGRKVAVACAERLIPYSLELGGKDPALVLADADLDRAANGIVWGAMFNSGQACISVERVYVEAPVYDEFVDKVIQRVARLRQGHDERNFSYDVGPLATSAQRDIVQRHVEEAVGAGARVVLGGKPTGSGTFFAPTVLVDVDQSMSCMTEETFGPTLPMVKVADAEEAIRLANDSKYGLSATVWTRDKERGESIARRLDVGAVNVNDVMSNNFAMDLPMGGWKQSGIGARLGGRAGLRKYCRAQAITSPLIPTLSKELLWYPASRRRAKVATNVLRASAARGLRRFGLKPRGV